MLFLSLVALANGPALGTDCHWTVSRSQLWRNAACIYILSVAVYGSKLALF